MISFFLYLAITGNCRYQTLICAMCMWFVQRRLLKRCDLKIARPFQLFGAIVQSAITVIKLALKPGQPVVVREFVRTTPELSISAAYAITLTPGTVVTQCDLEMLEVSRIYTQTS